LSKSKFCEKLDRDFNRNQETNKNSRYFSSQDVQIEEHNEHNEHEEYEKHEEQEQDGIRIDKEKPIKEKDNLRKQKRKEFLKMNKQKKRARIVIRNLSFQVYNC